MTEKEKTAQAGEALPGAIAPAREGNQPDVPRSSDVDAPSAQENEPDNFPREYVEQLRDESAKHRTRAQRADDLAARLHTSLVAATGRLADPSDLPFEESRLDDPVALTSAIDDLLARKPHLASRRPVGDVGQGATPRTEAVDLAGILRAGAN